MTNIEEATHEDESEENILRRSTFGKTASQIGRISK